MIEPSSAPAPLLPKATLDDRLNHELAQLQSKHRLRSLIPAVGIDFTSNDYLGYAQDHNLREAVRHLMADLPVSASGSRLLRGNHAWHTTAEETFAQFERTEAALFFNSGYEANVAILTTLTGRNDLILFDSLVHASTREGTHASLATRKSFSHNALDELAELLKNREQYREVFILVESLYSMDGDEAPLNKIAAIAAATNATLVVDEAHATGLFGEAGRGLIDEQGVRPQVAISMHTCGKALASHGAFVCGSRTLIDYLINRARPFIFSTALPPIIPATIVEVLRRLQSGENRSESVLRNAQRVRASLQGQFSRWRVPPGRSPIVPVIIGGDEEALRVAEILQRAGLDIRAIRPPSVPDGTARLRIAINYLHTESELDRLITELVAAERAVLPEHHPRHES